MSVVPEEWSDLGSLRGTLYESAWVGLAILVFGFVGYWWGWFGEATLTDGLIAVVVGPTLALITGYLFSFDDRVRAFWSGHGRRFVALFALIMGVQGLLSIAPVITTLTGSIYLATLLPVRIYMYSHTRRRVSTARDRTP
jgi:membrane-bound metal-dependent hydrolase YbcI (DUF457 family)